VLGVLRPAESAARRLILIAARGLAVKPAPSRPMPRVPIGRGPARRLAFQLFDPPRRLGRERGGAGCRGIPRIRVLGRDPRVVAALRSSLAPDPVATPPDDGRVDARRLTLRLKALKLALEDVPRQARRLARLLARRASAPGLRLTSPLRPGRPPGHRKVWVHDVDRVLAECHGLACRATAPDTS
jgi:hypothetical protein